MNTNLKSALTWILILNLSIMSSFAIEIKTTDGTKVEVGDGKVFVSNIDECYRIRTGEKGGDTLK